VEFSELKIQITAPSNESLLSSQRKAVIPNLVASQGKPGSSSDREASHSNEPELDSEAKFLEKFAKRIYE
jgi:uncharacterized membrane protein